MSRQFVLILAAASAMTLSARAEKPSGGAAAAAKPIPPPVGAEQPATPQINPNYVPGQQGPGQQGPNVPGGQQTPDLKKPFENTLPGGLQPGAIPRDTGGDAINTLRPDRETFGLDALNADERRRTGGRSPDSFGLRRRDRDMDDAVEALRNVTGKGGSNRDPDKPGAGFRGAVQTDPQGLLDSAGGGLAGDEPNGGLGRVTSRERTSDRGTATTYERSDGSRTTIYRDSSGAEVSREHRYRDSNGRDVTTTHTGDQEVTEVTGDGHTVRVETYRDNRSGDWSVSTYVDGRLSHSGRSGERPFTDLQASRTHDRLFRGTARDVDPDSSTGQGSGKVVGPGQKPDDPTMVRARDQGVGPGARPDENASASVTPQLNVNVDLVGQPNPGEIGGGGTPHRGYNPDDFVRPPRPNDP